jgi:HEAT repeat protein
MHMVFAAVLLTSLANATPDSAMPLPGYSQLTTATSTFPPTDKLLGKPDEPLDGLVAEGEQLRDAVISPPPIAPPPISLPSSARLIDGLRASNAGRRLAAIRSASVPRGLSAVSYLSGVLLNLRETSELRAAAAVALGRIGDGLAAKPLGEALNDPLPDVRYAAALALGRVPADGAATRLSNTLRSDPSWWVRYAAAIALGRTRKSFAVDALKERLALEPQWQVRLQIVRSLQDIGGVKAAEAVTFALRDGDAGVRSAAALALAEIGGDQQLPPLREAFGAETDASARSVLSTSVRRVLSKP